MSRKIVRAYLLEERRVEIAILWRGVSTSMFVIQGDNERHIVGTPVVACVGLEIVPGVLMMEPGRVGWWHSALSTDFLTAWRVAQFLVRARRLRQGPGQTIDALVSYLRSGDSRQLKELASDFLMSVDDFVEELLALRTAVPLPEELEEILRVLAGEVGDLGEAFAWYLEPLEQVEAAGGEFTAWTAELLKGVRRVREEQAKQEEAELREIDMPTPPEESVARLLADLGVTVIGNDSSAFGRKQHLDVASLDRIFREMVLGRYNARVPQLAWPLNPFRRSPFFVPELGLLGLRVNGRKVIIREVQYGQREGPESRFFLNTVVMGREVREGTLSVPEFRKMLHELCRRPYLRWWLRARR